MAQMDQVKQIAKPADPASKQSLLDKVVTSTPVVMTVVATVLAGLSSSELSTAQYHRSMAAQFQSKAGDQWSLYQAKRLRQTNNETALSLLQATEPVPALTPALLSSVPDDLARLDAGGGAATSKPAEDSAALRQKWSAGLQDPRVQQAIDALVKQHLPSVPEQKVDLPALQPLLDAIAANESEAQTQDLTRRISRSELDDAERIANANANAFDLAVKPLTAALDKLSALVTARSRWIEGQIASLPDGDAHAEQLRRTDRRLTASFAAARFGFEAQRYKEESRYNMAIAQLFEVEVRRSSGMSDRNRVRSKDFFYGMLAAQAAVTIATFSLAVRQRSLLWSLASAAGVIAIGLGVYVYLVV